MVIGPAQETGPWPNFPKFTYKFEDGSVKNLAKGNRRA